MSRQGNREHARERGHPEGLESSGGGIPFNTIPSPKERGRPETSDQPQSAKQICGDPTFQNGGPTDAKGPPQRKRLDGQNRPEGRLFFSPDISQGPEILQVPLERSDISIHLWSVMRSMGLYQDNQDSPKEHGHKI